MQKGKKKKSALPSYKIITLGDPSVGKTSILNRFVDDAFSEHHISTLGVDLKTKNMIVDGIEIKL